MATKDERPRVHVRKVAGSDCVIFIGYEPESQALTVEFGHGGTYEYTGVGAMEAAGFQTATSKGEYFNASIKGKYGHRRVS